MALVDVLRERTGQKNRTAQADCGSLGRLWVEALPLREVEALSKGPDGQRAVLYAACRELQQAGEALRRSGDVFRPDEIMQYLSDGEAARGAEVVLALSGAAAETAGTSAGASAGGNSGANTGVSAGTSTGTSAGAGLETDPGGAEGMAPAAHTALWAADGAIGETDRAVRAGWRTPDNLADLAEHAEIRPETVQEVSNNFNEIRHQSVQAERGSSPPSAVPAGLAGALPGAEAAENFRANGAFPLPAEGAMADRAPAWDAAEAAGRRGSVQADRGFFQTETASGQVSREFSTESALPEKTDKKSQSMGVLSKKTPQNVGGRAPDSQTGAAGAGGAKSVESRRLAAHETTSDSSESVHETTSDFSADRGEGLHETTSDFPADGGESLHESESDFSGSMHEIRSEVRKVVHEMESELAEVAARGLLEGLRRAAAAR